MSKDLKEYYKQKGVVVKLVSKYRAEIEMAGGDVLQVQTPQVFPKLYSSGPNEQRKILHIGLLAAMMNSALRKPSHR